jgi:hypothetical protein
LLGEEKSKKEREERGKEEQTRENYIDQGKHSCPLSSTNPLKEPGNRNNGRGRLYSSRGQDMNSPTSSSFLTPTPTQPALLAQHSSGSRRFLAVVIQFLLLLIPNGII